MYEVLTQEEMLPFWQYANQHPTVWSCLQRCRIAVKPVSWENYERNIRLHLNPALGNVKLAKLTPGRIQALYDK